MHSTDQRFFARWSLFELLYPLYPRWKRSRSVLFGRLIHDSTFTVLGWLHILWGRTLCWDPTGSQHWFRAFQQWGSWQSPQAGPPGYGRRLTSSSITTLHSLLTTSAPPPLSYFHFVFFSFILAKVNVVFYLLVPVPFSLLVPLVGI